MSQTFFVCESKMLQSGITVLMSQPCCKHLLHDARRQHHEDIVTGVHMVQVHVMTCYTTISGAGLLYVVNVVPDITVNVTRCKAGAMTLAPCRRLTWPIGSSHYPNRQSCKNMALGPFKRKRKAPNAYTHKNETATICTYTRSNWTHHQHA
jgi:hypothetical protein